MKELLNYLNIVNDKETLLLILNWEMDTIIHKDALDKYIDLSSKLETEVFQMITSKEYENLLNNAIKSKEFGELEEYKKKYFKDLKESFEKNKRIPQKFYEEFSKHRSKSKQVWVEAKEKNDYKIFKPYLEKNIVMTKELYNYMYPNSDNLYDNMLGDYEKNIKSSDVDPLFEKLKKEIIPIVKSLKSKELEPLSIDYDESKLIEIANFLLYYIGFDNNRGALGIFPHGYTTTINTNDVRIAFNKTKNIIEHASTIIHEGGHGIFEQYAGKEFKELNLLSINTIALHESQSRFYENILGRNINFWIPIYEEFKKNS